MTLPQPSRDNLVRLTIAHDGWASAVDQPAALVEAAIDATCRRCGVDGPVEVSVLLCDDHAIRQLNRRYRDQDRPTDTLSFPAEAPADLCPRPLGDIVVALQSAAGDAASADIPLARHLSHLIVHGCLHLLGHDHENDAEAAAMELKEIEILASLGIADPYAVR